MGIVFQGEIQGMTEQQVQARTRRKPRSLAQELVTVLTERIRSGQLKRGDKLPTESQIMAEEGVSRTVVREAISRLQAAGQVETRHGIGTFVLDAPSTGGFRIDPATVVTLREVLAVLELRIALEIESAGLAAQRRGFPVPPAHCPGQWQPLLRRHHQPPGYQYHPAYPAQLGAPGP